MKIRYHKKIFPPQNSRAITPFSTPLLLTSCPLHPSEPHFTIHIQYFYTRKTSIPPIFPHLCVTGKGVLPPPILLPMPFSKGRYGCPQNPLILPRKHTSVFKKRE